MALKPKADLKTRMLRRDALEEKMKQHDFENGRSLSLPKVIHSNLLRARSFGLEHEESVGEEYEEDNEEDLTDLPGVDASNTEIIESI